MAHTVTYVVTIPDCPRSVNQGGGGSRMHWATAYKEKLRWQDRYSMEFLAAGVAKRMLFCTVDVTVRWKYKHRRDSSNYFQPIFKPMLDALVSSGYIEDDTDEWVKVEPLKFEVANHWDYNDPRVAAEMIVKLDAVYL
jgi:hypothetical protein